jgi:hypothetical protein
MRKFWFILLFIPYLLCGQGGKPVASKEDITTTINSTVPAIVEQGIQGIQGIPGPQGLQGIQGIPGIQGEIGLPGIPGTKGDKGDQGIPGERGIPGVAGLNGYTPIKGVDYFDGAKGDQGIQGEQGIQGNPGIQGTSGISRMCINVQALTSSPADGATVYFGMLPKAPITTANVSKIYTPAGTIKRVEIYCYSGTAGTAEVWSLYVRKNNTTDVLIATLTVATNERRFTNSVLNITMNGTTDYVEIKGIQPAWATNPLTTIYGGYIYLE